MTDAPLLSLVCHPDLPCPEVEAIGVGIIRDGDGWVLDYRLEGDLAALRIPEAGQPLPVERLWAHTCFELFVARQGEAAYREFNFSPTGQWMRFDFLAYRQRSVSPRSLEPVLTVRRDARVLGMEVRLPGVALPEGPWQIALTAVVELADGRHCYWALQHPRGQPDFHHQDSRACFLNPLHVQKVPTP
ncbi:DOMON-like domain-containing protein [Zoogloea sp.]|uniref:DOMON-like domain-containing protein n=1 Tax=Zoogloea sp. TaxID=49181 RepID=UPI00262D15E1|nr:DOMON-like domain-containing protein [Zoogloea sp.]MDD3354524.1 DOMON-like domain-containing protein [Zoogloea sp.]